MTIPIEIAAKKKVKNVSIDDATREQLSLEQKPEGQVVIHIVFQTCYSSCSNCKIELRTDISLIPDRGLSKSGLVYTENIDQLDTVFNLKDRINRFTLVFEPLPKTSQYFDFVEPGSDGWLLKRIKRNKQDVYVLKIHRKTIRVLNSY